MLVDADVLTEWVGDRLPGVGQSLVVERMGQATGIGNALFFVRRAGHEWVLRRPSAVVNAPGASDMEREWRILSALEGTAVPHPRPLLLCTDPAPLGAPFLVMDKVDGLTPTGALPPPYDTAPARRDLAFAMVDAVAALGDVDWRAGGLEGLGRPEGFLERQVPRWLAQLERYRVRNIPELDFVADWLERNRPSMGRPGIIHGDYSPFNVMASYQETTRLAAVIDWDTGTIGDPLLDLGHLLARWTDPGEEYALTVDIEQRDGLPTRAELAARYAERTGRDLGALSYFQALALFKLAIILEGGYARSVRHGTPSRVPASMIDRLVRFAAIFARGERI
ncbi:phosphotransferase [Frankia sp. CcI49]|nr:phosphotransferase [Frankia sp. CcI49]